MSNAEEMPDAEKVEQMYEAVLDHLLTKPDIKEKLKASMNTEKKWQFVKMNDIFDNSGSSGWGSKQNVLLASIEKAKTPDIENLKRLKTILQFANKDFMEGFLAAGGVSVLLKAIDNRLSRRPVTELDVAVLYEIMTCCRAVMNNAVGMDGFMSVKGAVDILARCLRFDYRLFAIQMLEILSVCCYYSDSTASLVVGGMRLLARSQNEAPFACLSRALVQQDIEVKAAVMQFVNSMVMGVVDANQHALLRSDLNSVLLGENYDQAVSQVDAEIEILRQIEADAEEAGEGGDTFDMSPLKSAVNAVSATSSPIAPSKPARGAFRRLSVSLMNINGSPGGTPAAQSSPVAPIGRASSLNSVTEDNPIVVDRATAVRRTSMLRTKAITTLHGPRAISEQKVDAMLKNPSAMAAITDRGTLTEHDTDLHIETKVNGRLERVTVNPLIGTMAGSLTALKNTDKMESKLKDLLGGKKTKRRWYEVDAVNFKWCAGHDKENEYKGIVPVSSIVDIRSYSTDAALTASNPHAFEFETVERVFALGCETADEKDSWVTALQVSRDSSIMVNGSYKHQSRELTGKDLVTYAARFKKQGTVFQSIAIEDRRDAVANSGVDLSDARCVGEYLRSEALAAGHSDMLLGIMQTLLLIPQGSRGTWEAMHTGAKFLIERNGRDAAAGEEAFGDGAVISLLNKKATEGGGAYSQMSKLAMSAMESDQEAARLRTTVAQLEQQIAQLKQELQETPLHRFQARGSVFGETNPLGDKTSPIARAAAQVTQEEAAASTPATSTASGAELTTDSAASAATETANPIRRKAPPPPPKPARASTKLDSPVDAAGASTAPPPVPSVAPPAVPAIPAPAVTPEVAVSAEPVVDERYAKIVKMQKMLPEGAVRQKMVTEGFTPEEIDSFFANGPPKSAPVAPVVAPVASPPAVSSEPVVDERFAKFVKMQKMLPEGAVRQKMMTEGFNSDEIDSFFTNGPPMVAAAPAVPPPPVPATTAAAPVSAEPVVDERYAKFVKMQKMLPEGAVRQKMMTEGFNSAEIDSFFTNGPPMVTPVAAPAAVASAAPVPDERYAKFVKMQKMLPEGAVRQKMASEGFSPAEVDAFFTNGPPMVASAAPAAHVSAEPVVDERYAKYVKMQKMLPEGAVRQKMVSDGFTAGEIDGFFANGPPMVAGAVAAPPAGGAPPPPAPPAAPAAADPRFEKYTKMQKMLPEGAVRQKMMTDGFSAADIELFFSGGAAPAASASAAPAVPKGPTLSPMEAIKFAKYEKMLKMLPEGAVRQKMVADELSPEDIEKFFGAMNSAAAAKAAAAPAKPAAPKAPVVELPPEGMSAKPKIVPGAKLKGIFWTKLKNSEIKGTVWHQMQEHKLAPEEVKRLEELFGTKVAVVNAAAEEEKAAKAAAAEKKGGKKLIAVLDAQRTQNVMIIMGKVRKNAEQILKLVIDLDPETLNHELCHTLYEVLPTPEEVEAVKPHKDPSLLDNASQLLFHFNRMPRILQRMECHEIAFSWANQANAAASQLGVIECACVELAKSQQNMQALLSIVLSIGNYLNGSTARGEAYGVGLDIFAKFSNLKASQQNESLMHFLARQAELKDPHLSELSDKWVALWAAADISYKQLTGEVATLDTLVNKMNSEFTRIKDSKDNIGLDGKMEDCKGPAMNPLHRRLNGFLLTAKPRIATIRQQVKNVEAAVEKEMNKYGDSLKKTAEDDACKLFFSTIASFARAYRTACDENAAKRLAAEKAQKAASDAANKESAKTAGGAAAGGVPGGMALPGMGGPAKGKAKTENIFGMFQASQEASSDDVIAEFKLKMAKRMAKNIPTN